MFARLDLAGAQLERNPPPATAETNAESLAFLRWLLANNFIFLGIREFGYAGDQEHGELIPRPELGLGLLRDEAVSVLRQGPDEHRLTPQGRAFFLNSPPVIVVKANSKSTVHRRIHMDTIGIKLYGAGGNITGGVLIAGLFHGNGLQPVDRQSPAPAPKGEQGPSQFWPSAGQPLRPGAAQRARDFPAR